ncbi:MAG: type I pullulanase [Acutalibacteraceae bacterium]
MNAKRISKSVVAFVLTMMMVISCFALPASFVNAAGITAKFHYLREDGNYDKWSLWTWTDSDGWSTDFVDEGDANGAVATVEVPDGATSLGFIVRKGNWEAKDPDGDRSVDIGAVVSGTIDVYCKSGSADFDVVNGSDVVLGTKLTKATLNTRTEIAYTLTQADEEVTAEEFVVADALGNPLTITGITPDGAKGTITVAEEMDYLKNYTITFRGTTINVKMPEYFSSKEFEDMYTYDGDDLGATYTKEKTSFRVWAPTADQLYLNLYDEGNGGEATDLIIMDKDVKGTWVASADGDLNGKYYTYTAVFGNTVNDDIVDPYARTVGVNGKRGMILDLDSTNPDGWNSDERHTYANTTDMSIYELHIRDFSSDPDSGIKNTGKYIAFTETGTTDSNGVPTGIDHLKDLGITTVHILPSYDFGSVDETKLDTPQFNWGYDPVNYNAPEGSYSTDPYHGEVRVNEYKQMVQSLHNAGIGVVMDVVYNHTYNTNYCFNKLVPGYFYRTDSNGSGCGNDVASERSMVSKFIVDSVAYWASEYHLDGFRFDLMGLIDTDTMNDVRAALDKIDPSICIYGEGWTMNTNISKEVSMANQSNASLTPGVGYFSDTIRDAIKGSVFEAEDPGYVNGNLKKAAGIKNGVLGTPSWSPAPTQTITYSSCHDNYTLWDKIASSNPDDSEADRIKQNLLAAAIVYTSQGVPFIQAGEEFLRTKVKDDGTFEHNSYASPDSVNLLDYSRITDYKDVYNYYKGLISFRKAHSAFRMTTNEDVNKYLSFVEDGLDDGVIAYSIDGAANNEVAEQIFVIYNPNREATNVTLPDGDWDVYVSGNQAGTTVLSTAKGEVSVEPISATVLVKGGNQEEPSNPDESEEPSQPEESKEPSNTSTDNSDDNTSTAPQTSNTTSNTTTDNTTTNTGDTFPVALVVIFAVAAAAVITLVVISSKKSKSSK